jgi:class 3 adenylate cyclase
MEEEHSQKELLKRIFHLKTLFDMSQEIGVLAGTGEIIKNLLMMIMGTFGVLDGVLLLIDNKESTLEASFERGLGESALKTLSLAIESEYLGDLAAIKDIQILNKKNRDGGNDKKDIGDVLSSCNIHIWIPFSVNDDCQGGIGLGDKLSGEPYTSDDQELLYTLAHQGAAAIKNAKLVEQMRKDEVIRTNLGRYLSPQIVEQVIHNNMEVNLGGDRKVVTVLFSDIRNFTTFTEARPPDQIVRILNEYFTEMAGIIFEHHGSLDKYIGDAIVAVFGSLIAVENPAQNAVQAAIKMMKQLPVLNRKWMSEYDFSMEIGIGINTGDVFLGNIGSPERMEFSVIGDTVNVASRFSGLAKPGQILFARETLNCLSPDISYTELPPSFVKGKTDKLKVFEVKYN